MADAAPGEIDSRRLYWVGPAAMWAITVTMLTGLTVTRTPLVA